jgi:hypothetical protein
VSPDTLRVGLDLDGSLESLGNSMTDLADALDDTGECQLVRFRTLTAAGSAGETRLARRALWAPWWRRSLGRSIDGLLAPVDVIHVAGLCTPPTGSIPLVISVDDLRPLREETRTHLRINQLRRAVAHGALLVASSRTASHEVLEVLAVQRSRVVVVPPAVPHVETTRAGRDLVVNVTGLTDRFLAVAPDLVRFAQSEGSRVVALTSYEVGQRVRATGLELTVLARQEARGALANARVGVPRDGRDPDINRELLDGAAALAPADDAVLSTIADAWTNESRRAIMVAAGRSRAVDYAPATAARAYVSLYRDVVRGWSS